MTKKNEKKHDKRDSEKVESSIASVPSSLAAKGKNVTLITGKTTRSSQFLLRGKSRSKTKLSPSESRASDAPNRVNITLK
ncbi:hypothetical protein HHI36_010419 [Cryptolaemus montrouzieri]|uniref:Uncharacterized protein n=1 Tax=Cryptolaemus montrouzieri TaxID=559131 RepID=A0ABD2MIS8_9CUCU